jgi:hypothetical protein
MNSKRFAITRSDQSANKFVQFLLVFSRDKALPSCNGKDKLQIDLGVGVGHMAPFTPQF